MSKGYISMLLDASGSMSGQEQRVVNAANEYLDTVKTESDGKVKVAIRLFDSGRFDVVREGRLETIKKLTVPEDYSTGGLTPLYDSIAKAISETEKAAKKRKVVLLVDTDGEENLSKETTIDALRKLIEKKTKDGWQFIFVASNVDAWEAAAGMGIQNLANYRPSDRVAAYQSIGSTTSDFLSGRTADVELDSEGVLQTKQ